MNSLPKTVTRQRRDCDFNPGPSAPESSTLTTRLPSHPSYDNLTIMPKLRSTYDGRLIYETSYEERRAFLRYDSLAKL